MSLLNGSIERDEHGRPVGWDSYQEPNIAGQMLGLLGQEVAGNARTAYGEWDQFMQDPVGNIQDSLLNWPPVNPNDWEITEDDFMNAMDSIAPGAGLLGMTKTMMRQLEAERMFRKHGIDVDASMLPTDGPAALANYGKSLEVPAVRRRENMRIGNRNQHVAEDVYMPDRKIITPSDIEKRLIVPNVGDQSRIAKITQTGGVPHGPVYAEGGPRYSLLHSGEDDPLGWASMFSAANSKNNNFLTALNASGENPIGMYSAMDRAATAFSTPPAELMIKQVESIGVPKKDIQAFNAELRRTEKIVEVGEEGNKRKIKVKPFTDFKGIDTQEGMDQVMGRTPESFSAGELRKQIVSTMGAAKWRNKGFPVYKDVEDVVINPEMLGTRRGDSGFSMYEANPAIGLLGDAQHMSYDAGIPGQYMGGFENQVPAEIMYPDIFSKLSKKRTKSGNPYTRGQILGSLMSAHHMQQATPEWVDNVSRYLEGRRGLLE